MTPTKWLLSFGLFGLFAGGAWWLSRARPAVSVAPVAVTAATSAVVTPPSSAMITAAATATDTADFRAGAPMKRVMDLYERESQRVGQVDPDPRATQKRLEASARELTPEEITWLAGQAMDIKNDADARFFAAFLLGLSRKEAAVKALGAIAVSPVPASKNERWVEQERAFRASAIEGFCRACKDFPVLVKDTALDVVSRQGDEFLGDRAHRCLYSCQTGKSIESQDKEALEKARRR